MTAVKAITYSAIGYLAAIGLLLGWMSKQIDRAVTLGGRL